LGRDDREAAQNSGAFLESEKTDNESVERSYAEQMLGRRGEDDLEPERTTETFRHIAMTAAIRRFLHRDDVRIKCLKFANRDLQPLPPDV
jgi:hypothetical protein